ncbi:MAG TPA: hypothetical protein VM118_10805 [Acidobacteriota bacterium]|nr:hypothetical protein [Acidobacteriota bacterium]
MRQSNQTQSDGRNRTDEEVGAPECAILYSHFSHYGCFESRGNVPRN